MLNLNTLREDRAKAFAARREQAGLPSASTLPIVFGDGDPVIAELGPELPLEVFAPLLEIDVDLPALIVQIMEAADNTKNRDAATEAVIGVLVTNPNLPRDLVEATKKIGRNLLGDAGYEALMKARPSTQDIGALIGGLMAWYGVDLGEFLRSSPSAIDGGTSQPISPTTTPESTPTGPGDGRESPDSSGSAD